MTRTTTRTKRTATLLIGCWAALAASTAGAPAAAAGEEAITVTLLRWPYT